MSRQPLSFARHSFRRYFGDGSAPIVSDVGADIWTPDAYPAHSREESKDYSFVLLEQYKIYVEMADRISARRGLTNTFFLTLNSALFTVIGVFGQVGRLQAHGCWSFLSLPLSPSAFMVLAAPVLQAAQRGQVSCDRRLRGEAACLAILASRVEGPW